MRPDELKVDYMEPMEMQEKNVQAIQEKNLHGIRVKMLESVEYVH